jgi:hypothetical protein
MRLRKNRTYAREATVRRRFITDHVDLGGASVLDIGALDEPMFTRDDCDVKYLASSYRDSHCHVFSQETFPALWTDLEDPGLIEWTLKDFENVPSGMNEFHEMLAKSRLGSG